MKANPVLLQKKYARVVSLLAERAGLSYEQALDVFYHSVTYDLMRNGISDMHCMSDGYLVQDLLDEIHESKDYDNSCPEVISDASLKSVQ
ncbi:DUF3791 domain-containing protein [Gardnerella sp. DNF01192]|uniref:DUF3791 domain-containing protein n=1 Tax=Gardnerella TaxID=2701 RepID=UPI0039F099DC